MLKVWGLGLGVGVQSYFRPGIRRGFINNLGVELQFRPASVQGFRVASESLGFT